MTLVLSVPLALLANSAAAVVQAELTKILASDGTAEDAFGYSVSISGDTAVMGAAFEDDLGENSGAAYVFVRSGEVWTEQAKLLASDGAAEDRFGTRVSVSGDTAVVGTIRGDGNAEYSGAAYVFVRSGDLWTEQTKLLASDGESNDYFGSSVSVSGETAVIGAYGDDDKGNGSGAAYVFVRSGGMWTEQAKLLASDGESNDFFGFSVSVSSDTAVIGAYGDDDKGNGSGAAYVFIRSGDIWSEQAKLVASDGAEEDWFGRAVSIDGASVLIGARLEEESGENSGAAYVFVETGAVWTEQAKLLASDGAAEDWFGASVSIGGDTAVVGAPFDDDKGESTGAAYVFERSGDIWSEQAKLVASDGAAENWFGAAVSLAGEKAVIGAPFNSDTASFCGAAYVFSVSYVLVDGFESGDASAWSSTVQ